MADNLILLKSRLKSRRLCVNNANTWVDTRGGGHEEGRFGFYMCRCKLACAHVRPISAHARLTSALAGLTFAHVGAASADVCSGYADVKPTSADVKASCAGVKASVTHEGRKTLFGTSNM
jgi:hypothetical protein